MNVHKKNGLREDNSLRDQIPYLNRQQIVTFCFIYCWNQVGIRITSLHGICIDVHGIDTGKYRIKVCTLGQQEDDVMCSLDITTMINQEGFKAFLNGLLTMKTSIIKDH